MDVGELLSYKPAKEPRRVAIEDDDVEVRPRSKRLANIPEAHHDRRPTKMMKTQDENKENFKQDLEGESELPEGESGVLDDTTLKKLLLSFEKKVLKNQELRIKFPDQPEKFMDSEIELNDILLEMHVIATQPDLYHILVELNSVSTILGLLTHENTDISIAVVDLLQEMTDIDTLNESEEGATTLIDAMLNAQVIAVLVQNLERLDEKVKEEAEGVHNTLAIIENLAEFKTDMCVDAVEQGLMQWILKRIKSKMPFDANKLYASEILSILLQRHDENRQSLGTMEGIDVLLQQLAYFKRNDPSSAEEHEMMENLFDCICSSLMFPANRERFLKGEGLQLMNLMLREKKMSRNGALKVLDHAMCNAEGADNCNKFVDILGLRAIFPLFMKTPKKNWKKGLSIEQHEEHVCSIIASMLKNCKGQQRQRLLNKFTENDHEKVDRLMELHFKYLDKVHYVDVQIEKEKSKLSESEIDSVMEEEFYLRRLEGGLFTLQLIDYIMVDICCSGPPSIKQRVLQILNLRGGSIKTIRNVMREYAGNMGDANDAAIREAEQQRLLQFVDRF
ncbi:beta-catenin-like protein 1 [Parasteatoda tepidariorum]|uniref:beta-catenin-like protein 1 n=1 Tax=Parasteatoda tepidariorum TaxID=114398 RepID=UPI00077F9CEB|nr:beta-catenin-like protein 1 [Parasteatoda tepidariorum]